MVVHWGDVSLGLPNPPQLEKKLRKPCSFGWSGVVCFVSAAKIVNGLDEVSACFFSAVKAVNGLGEVSANSKGFFFGVVSSTLLELANAIDGVDVPSGWVLLSVVLELELTVVVFVAPFLFFFRFGGSLALGEGVVSLTVSLGE